jgi:hypothetical protein
MVKSGTGNENRVDNRFAIISKKSSSQTEDTTYDVKVDNQPHLSEERSEALLISSSSEYPSGA